MEGDLEDEIDTESNKKGDIPRILYHGTTYGYIKEIKEIGASHYTSSPQGVYLSNKYLAYSYALKRARQFKNYPVLLIIDKQKLDVHPKREGQSNLIVPKLNWDSFLIYDPKSPTSKLVCNAEGLIPENIEIVEELERQIKSITRKQLQYATYSIFNLLFHYQ